MSGLYAHAHGVQNNFTEYPANFTSFPLRLQQEGYDTAYFGKWHMGEENDSPRPGFNWFVTHKGQGKYFDTEWNINGAGAKKIPGLYDISGSANWANKADYGLTYHRPKPKENSAVIITTKVRMGLPGRKDEVNVTFDFRTSRFRKEDAA